ncbi:MAG TPA: protoporphyrinogen oxidase, partial [Candidatus Polarisedimenticolaceae bacterium]|nr:protoporphyrinogen oxidase [Candidatus Polarisedimenticolaceae bacterium]
MSAAPPLDVAVLGGGISGLTVGFLLHRRGVRVAVFEAQRRAGGCIRSWRQGEFLFELGPNTVLDSAPEIGALCREAGLEERRLHASASAQRRYIVRDARLTRLPAGPGSFLTTRAFSPRAKLRLCLEPFVRRAGSDMEESIAAFTRRRLGQELLDYAVGPFVSGVYAGDPERLSVRWATPKIHALERQHGSLIRGALARRKGPAPAGGLFSFPDGLEELPLALAGGLGPAWRGGHTVLRVERAGDGWSI